MDHEIRPSRPLIVPVVILAWGLVPDRPHGDRSPRSWVPASAPRTRVDVDPIQPISSVETAVSPALRGGEPR